MQLTQIVAPAQEPITLAEAKLFMKVLETDEDVLIETMIASAREYVENYTNRQLETATFELITDKIDSGFKLPKNPIQSITKIEYMDNDSNYQLMPTTDYYLYYDNGIGKIQIVTPISHKGDKRAIKITFIAGYDDVPFSIKTYIKMLVSTLFENREQYVVGVSIDTNANPLVNRMLEFCRVQPI